MSAFEGLRVTRGSTAVIRLDRELIFLSAIFLFHHYLVSESGTGEAQKEESPLEPKGICCRRFIGFDVRADAEAGASRAEWTWEILAPLERIGEAF